jgi:putative flippase GtrA
MVLHSRKASERTVALVALTALGPPSPAAGQSRNAASRSANLRGMPDDATTVEIVPASIPGPAQIRPHRRLLHGMRRPANWLQLVRFGLVGGLGFVVNLAVYTLCVHRLGIDYHIAAVGAWMVAVMNNFVLNRSWTFDARDGQARFQAVRFVLVSLVAFGFSLLLLSVLVETAGIPKVPAQALAVAASTPLNFIGNKLWSFRANVEGLSSARP